MKVSKHKIISIWARQTKPEKVKEFGKYDPIGNPILEKKMITSNTSWA
jgi:hypothetical protein